MLRCSDAGVNQLVVDSIAPVMKGTRTTLASSASHSLATCVAALWPMREQPAVLCQDMKISSFSVTTALGSHLFSACETKHVISCESRGFYSIFPLANVLPREYVIKIL